MFKRITTSAIIFGMAALAPPLAHAKTCGPRNQLVVQLTEKYHELRQGAGLSSATQVVEFWASDRTGTFSILVTYPNGTTCILATGNNWTAFEPNTAALDPKA